MATNLSFVNDSRNQKIFAKGVTYIAEIEDFDDRSALDWVKLDDTAETTITLNIAEKISMNDSGGATGFDQVVTHGEIEASFLSRDAQIRKMFMSSGTQTVKGKAYALFIADNTYYDSTGAMRQGVWMLYQVHIRQSSTIPIGTDGQYTFSGVLLRNNTCSGVEMNFPSTPCVPFAETSVEIPAGEFFYTEDLAIV